MTTEHAIEKWVELGMNDPATTYAANTNETLSQRQHRIICLHYGQLIQIWLLGEKTGCIDPKDFGRHLELVMRPATENGHAPCPIIASNSKDELDEFIEHNALGDFVQIRLEITADLAIEEGLDESLVGKYVAVMFNTFDGEEFFEFERHLHEAMKILLEARSQREIIGEPGILMFVAEAAFADMTSKGLNMIRRSRAQLGRQAKWARKGY